MIIIFDNYKDDVGSVDAITKKKKGEMKRKWECKWKGKEKKMKRKGAERWKEGEKTNEKKRRKYMEIKIKTSETKGWWELKRR